MRRSNGGNWSGPGAGGCGRGRTAGEACACCACRRRLEIMLPTTPTIKSPTQTRIPMSRMRRRYLVLGPASGGCGSDELSVDAPIDARISVSACTFLRR
jgi:hypothetical protein